MSHASLNHSLFRFLAEHSTAARLVVAYSGGLDSTVLLHLLTHLRDQSRESRPIQAIHINHGLSPNSGRWQRHCEEVCSVLGVPLQVCRVSVSNQGGGLEAAARDQRYKAFEEMMQPGDALLLAHHLDDQAETLLLRLMRGAGPKGLAAMPEVRSLGNGVLLRPLLDVSRLQLHDWANTFGLSWVDDESNESLDFDRNYLRHSVLPLLEQRWPGFAERWQQSARLCGEADQQIQEQAELDVALAALRPERWGWSLDLAALQSLSEFRRGNLMREVTRRLQLPAPDSVHLQQLEAQLVVPRPDAKAQVRWGDMSVRHFQGRLYWLPDTVALTRPPDTSWDLQSPLRWPGAELLAWQDAGEGLCLPSGSEVQVTLRQPGDRCRPAGRGHSQTLKKLLQEYRLEPWLRDRVPVLRLGEEIVAVGDLWVCHDYFGQSPNALRLSWQRPL